MRPFVIIALACLACLAGHLHAQSTDPGDLFVNAYFAVEAGKKAEAAGNFREANSKYRYAQQILEQISDRYPSWQPSIVDYRKKRTSEALAGVQEKIGKHGGGKAPAASAAPPRAVEMPAEDPGVLLPPSDVLPGTPPRRETPRTAPARVTETELPTRNPLQEIDEKMKRLERDLNAARDEVDKAHAEKADLARQLEEALKVRDAADKKREGLEQRAKSAESGVMRATAEGRADDPETKALVAELADARKQLRDLRLEAESETEYRQQLNDRLRGAQKKIASLSEQKTAAEKANSDVPTRIAAIQKQLDQARKEKDELTARLTKTETDLKKALTERDEALAQVTKMREEQKKVDKLLAENADLMGKLAAAEKTIALTKADGVKKDQEIAALRKETTSLKAQLAAAQKESADYQKQMAALQTKLDEANTQIGLMKADNSKSLAERNRLQEENLILRGAVLRQQKEEARRAATKKTVLEELGKIEGKSRVLMDQIAYLSSPVVKLTAKERKLFKTPELQISDTEISLSAARTDEGAPAAEAPAPMAEAQAPGPTVTTSEAPAPEPKPTPAPPPVDAPKIADTKPAPEPAKEPESTPAPETKSEMELATNKPTPTAPVDSAKPAPAAEKSASPAEDASAKPASAGTPTGDPAPLASSGGGTSNTSGVAMNLPADLIPQAREGKDQFERGNYREAEKVYERILTKAPNNLYTLSNLGVVYFRSGKFKRAEEMFKKAIAIAPEDGFSHCTLGIVYYSQQKYDEAVSELTKALAINPRNATAHNYLGITASQKGWQEAAQKELEKAVELDPNYADAHFNLAVVFATQQPANKENARKFYKRATELGAEPDTALEQLIK